jgi:hypothetical protein
MKRYGYNDEEKFSLSCQGQMKIIEPDTDSYKGGIRLKDNLEKLKLAS